MRLLRPDLIRHEVAPRDADWFARSRIKQFARFPWLVGDAARGLFALWLLMPAPDIVIVLTLASLIVVWLGELILRRALATPIADTEWRLTQIRCFLLLRGLVWALIAGAMVRYAGPNIGIVVSFSLGALLFDLLFMLSLPVTGLAAGTMLVLGMAAGLLGVPGANAGVLALVTLGMVAALRFALFNLYYLFATRQLRTRRLGTANETIRSLLSQYDEHGADALVEVDREGQLVRPSPRLCELLGKQDGELQGTPISNLFEPGRDRSALLAAISRRHQFRNMLVPLRIRGERHWWSISGCAVLDAEGQEEGFRCFAQDVTEQRANEERIRIMAMRDNLTGLVNRAIFTDRLAEVLAGCSSDAQAGVLFLDLDSFKLVNDTYGHAAGDTVLIEAARRLEGLLGPNMLAARLGGDEFAVLAWDVTAPEVLTDLGKAVVVELSKPIVRDDMILPCGASVGLALAPEHGEDGVTLLRAADLALYEAKSRGRGVSVLFHPQLLRDLQERRELEMNLRVALERGEFEVWYQPLLDIASRRTVGYEALLRWNHPKRGIVEPSQFIPLAEEAGLIANIGEWALREALSEAATWHEELTIAVNVSPAQMRGEALLGQVVSALANSGVAPERLELEITETLLMEDCEMHLRTLHRLRALGVRIALDDFGTGYSSLNYLRRFPFDKLKVDRSFVSDIVEETESGAIVETVLNLARKFDMKTTAEGIESEAQLAKLNAMGCSQAQGFLFDRPLPPRMIPAAHRKAGGRMPRLQMA
ncbi:diguanylate cyclase (GGDEF)-like protein/PAS domain S-box-containing protein [Novosphingobium chloroacetimidivorans]|uniref:Diguanylate cyclase (GGDEF)-like protein/PAS domain S-box-containing protein n=1 Tax=Novosphingobium chloroacetimidivorans TaxID=1428314 RepID=A0A7W7KA44_9SPHN|nr:EAL domain-containing protein [Novosphingobium chloroacetimidivorans]MBB4859032.1 diguanylate cyclase (GGDEF)-like protein/PAS domain S-box-containing protein [Novosphingobium chloroacetimidivorans]